MAQDDQLPSAEEILAIHEEIAEQSDMKFRGIRVGASRLRIREIVDNADAHDEIHGRAASLLRNLITAHVFEDGNKRTAWATTWIYLERHGTQPAESGLEVARVLRRIRRYDVDEIAAWLESGTLDRNRLDP